MGSDNDVPYWKDYYRRLCVLKVRLDCCIMAFTVVCQFSLWRHPQTKKRSKLSLQNVASTYYTLVAIGTGWCNLWWLLQETHTCILWLQKVKCTSRLHTPVLVVVVRFLIWKSGRIRRWHGPAACQKEQEQQMTTAAAWAWRSIAGQGTYVAVSLPDRTSRARLILLSCFFWYVCLYRMWWARCLIDRKKLSAEVWRVTFVW